MKKAYFIFILLLVIILVAEIFVKEKDSNEYTKFLNWSSKFIVKTTISYFVASTIITTGGFTGATIGTIAFGTSSYGVKRFREIIDNDNEALKFIEDTLRDTSLETLTGGLAETKAANVVSQLTRDIGHTASTEIANKGITNTAKRLIDSSKKIPCGQNVILSRTYLYVYVYKSGKHSWHKFKGKDHDPDCEICND